jgi:hypothetical protein
LLYQLSYLGIVASGAYRGSGAPLSSRSIDQKRQRKSTLRAIRSVENSDPARDLAGQHQPETLVDFVKPVGAADQTVEIDLFSMSRSASIGKSMLGHTEP